MATSMATKAGQNKCMPETIKGLKASDLYALHTLKHEVVAGIFRLYASVPPDKADKVLTAFFATLVTAVENEVATDNAGGGIVI